MKFTFGKYEGFTIEELAVTREGRNYLEWAAQNLRNLKWAGACRQALETTPADRIDSDVRLSARVLARAEGYSLGEAEIYIQERIWENEQIEAEIEAYQNEVADAYAQARALFAEYGARMGKSPEDVKKGLLYIRRMYDSPADVPASRFSSPKAHSLTIELAGRLAGNEWWETN